MTAEVLALDQVSVVFMARGRFFLRSVAIHALSQTSIKIDQAETVAVVGESGSGKTTLGRVSLRLIRPTAGRVYFQGKDVTDLEEAHLRDNLRLRAQAVFQDPFSSLDPYMNVGQIVEEPLLIHGIGSAVKRREWVLQSLEEVRLIPSEEFAAKFPHTLSGGERQRVAIARALVLEPVYVVADEPVSMIDASSRAEILDLMRTLQKRRGIAFLYITHDLATARHFSHRLVILYLGRILEMGLTEAVIKEPLHPYTIALIEAVPEPDPANRFRMRRVVPGEPPNPAQIPRGCSFHPRCPSVASNLCQKITPPLNEVKPGHLVACHLYG